jgi:hypothetical protein
MAGGCSIDNRTKDVVAIKIIDLEAADDEIEDIQQEMTVLAQVGCYVALVSLLLPSRPCFPSVTAHTSPVTMVRISKARTYGSFKSSLVVARPLIW